MNRRWPSRAGEQTTDQPGAEANSAGVSLSELYHENSKLRDHDQGLYSWISFVNSSAEVRHVISRPFSHHLGYPTLALPRKLQPTLHAFEDIIARRRTVRTFSGEPMSLEALAKVLYLGDGVVFTEEARDGSRWSLRTYRRPAVRSFPSSYTAS